MVASENMSDQQVEGILTGFDWSQKQIDQVLKIFFPYQSKIRAFLKLYGRNPPKLVDVNWRLDYEIEVILLMNS